MRQTHRDTMYPVIWPADPEGFLSSETEMIAWVAVTDDDGEIIGHVAIHDAEGDPAFGPVHELTGQPSDSYSVIARLLVAPASQGTGAGKALLDVAVQVAEGTGRHAILDVVTTSPKAIAFYEALDWVRVGPVEIEIPGEPVLTAIVFAAPGLPMDQDADEVSTSDD